jgi:hypothetical protein
VRLASVARLRATTLRDGEVIKLDDPHGDETACEQENCGADHGDGQND